MRKYGTGSRRDSRSGKGRYDLISPFAIDRLAKHMEKGAEHYGERNWELGQPVMDYMDSALRHINYWMMGKRDEDHLAAAFWNLHCVMHMEELGTANFEGEPEHWNFVETYPEDTLFDVCCVECKKFKSVLNGDMVCVECQNASIDSKAPVTPPKALTPRPKVFVPKSPEEGLGARTEGQNVRACTYSSEPCVEKITNGRSSCYTYCKRGYHGPQQELFDQHQENETTEMIRREAYRSSVRHKDYTGEQLTLEGLAKYD